MKRDLVKDTNSADAKQPLPTERISVDADTPVSVTSPPAWMLEPTGLEPSHSDTPSKPANADVADLILELIINVHEKTATWSGYDGFRLDESDVRLWRRVCVIISKYIPFERLPELIAIIAVALVEITKIGGFVRYYKATHQTPGNRAAPAGT